VAGVESFIAVEKEAALIMPTGSFSDILGFRLANEVSGVLFQLFLTVPTILPLFLIGLYFGKTGMFHDVGQHIGRWKKVLWIGLCVGAPLVLLSVLIQYGFVSVSSYLTAPLAEFLNMIGGPFLMLFYVAGMVLLTQKSAVERMLMPFASVGRMAFTNYLMQSVVAVIIFNGYGLGLFGQVSKGQGVLIAIAIFAVQVVLSHLLLKRFNQGPLEFIWRKWTYSRVEKKREA